MRHQPAANTANPTDHRLWRWALVATLAATAAALFTSTTPSATAQSGNASVSNTRVAIVDIIRLVNELDAFKAGQQEVDDLAAELTEQVESARQRVEEAQNALELATDETRERLVNEALAAGIDFRAANANRQIRIRLKQNQVLRATWNRVKAGIDDYANAAGYDAIVADDSNVEPGIPLDADPEAFKSFMTERRVLHASDRIDVTDELITRLNNDFQAEMRNQQENR
jgi:Skp family chaperone for outer membrane proteins